MRLERGVRALAACEPGSLEPPLRALRALLQLPGAAAEAAPREVAE